MNSFNLNIVSFDKIIVDEAATYCSIITDAGKMGFEARHEPFVSVLKSNSKVEFKTAAGEQKSIEVVNGLFSFENGNCTITIFEKV